MSDIVTYLPFYIGQTIDVPKRGLVPVTGLMVDLALHGKMDLTGAQLLLKPIESVTDAHCAEVAAIEYPERKGKGQQETHGRTIITLFNKIGAMPATIARVAQLGYDVFGLIDKGLARAI